GFVEMPKQGDAKAAMISLNGSDLDGQKIRVKKDRSKSSASDASPVPPDA
ncbi:MAG: RNA-binding protein, partial [Gammaproteobacteria bacterium]|nr:RNA-binding protein [Gammaproteobacteria bacterium]